MTSKATTHCPKCEAKFAISPINPSYPAPSRTEFEGRMAQCPQCGTNFCIEIDGMTLNPNWVEPVRPKVSGMMSAQAMPSNKYSYCPPWPDTSLVPYKQILVAQKTPIPTSKSINVWWTPWDFVPVILLLLTLPFPPIVPIYCFSVWATYVIFKPIIASVHRDFFAPREYKKWWKDTNTVAPQRTRSKVHKIILGLAAGITAAYVYHRMRQNRIDDQREAFEQALQNRGF